MPPNYHLPPPPHITHYLPRPSLPPSALPLLFSLSNPSLNATFSLSLAVILFIASPLSNNRPSRSALSLYSRSRSLSIHLESITFPPIPPPEEETLVAGLCCDDPVSSCAPDSSSRRFLLCWEDVAEDMVAVRRAPRLPDLGMREAREEEPSLDLALGPVGMDGEGEPPGLDCGSAVLLYPARAARASAAARRVWFSTLSWR